MQFDALLADLPATFDKSPNTFVAWQISHPDGLAWTVTADNRLLVATGDRAAIEYALIGRTLPELGDLLNQNLAIQTLYIHPDASSVSAASLHPDSGATPDDRAATLYAYRSPLRAIIAALATALDTAEADGAAALDQLILPGASAHWADYWGKHFGVPRATGEADTAYTQRIVDEVFRARNNNRALENNVRRYTGHTVDIKEPWRQMWTLGRSRLDRFDDALPGLYYRYHVLHPIARETVDWNEALPVIDADRPAGSLLWTPSYRPPGYVVEIGGDDGWQVVSVHSHLFQVKVRGTAAVLDVNLVLGGTAPTAAPRALCGHWHPATIDDALPNGALNAQHQRVLTAQIIVFDQNITGGWRGSWNAQTWNERADAAEITVPSQNTSEPA